MRPEKSETTLNKTIQLHDTEVSQPEAPYSAFSKREKMLISYAASLTAMFSGLSSFIYYPAITALSRSLNVSIQLINLTITSYQVVSGVAPSVLGDMADRTGRRPTLLIAFTLYLAANLGLAAQENYTALVCLRCLQSFGASGTIAIAYGFIADIARPAERGSYVGILMGFTNSAPSLGPVLGGVLTEKLSWHWIFWMLSIAAGCHLLCLLMFLPETSRELVGDGSVIAARAINRSLYSIAVSSIRPRDDAKVVYGKKAKLRFPNPVSCLVTLFQKSTFLVLLVGSIQYTIYGCLASSLSTQMIRIYGLDYLTAGLAYLPCGIGGIIAALSTGKLLDHDYRIYARRYGFPLTKSAASDLYGFPLEKARLRSSFYFLALSVAATMGFGWSLHFRAHLAVPLVLQFLTGASQVALFTVCGTLLTDLNPENSATVQASYNLVRCTMSAAGIAALQAMINGVGIGWCMTIYSFFGLLCVPLFVILEKLGAGWRRATMDKRERPERSTSK